VSRSLAAIEAINAAPSSMREELDRPFTERAVTPAIEWFGTFGRRFTPAARQDAILSKLEGAGSPIGWDVQRVVATKALGLFSGLALAVLFFIAIRPSVLTGLLIAVGVPALGWFLPDLILSSRAGRRADQIRKDLPDALDLLTISVEAGLAFDAALKQVATNTTGPVAEEFARVLAEMQVGASRTEAIRALGERTNVDEMRAFATAMVQADAFGIPIADVLRVQSKESRVKRRQRAEEMAQKIPVKILFPLVFCILPCIFIIVIGPAVLNVVDQLTNTL
jgi:tight adherence protein C